MAALFPTTKKESLRSFVYRLGMNYWPCIWCSGGRVTFLSSDFTEMHVRLSLGIRTNNRVGTVYGGSIYSSIDPHFMLLFMEVLGKDYVVWDKAASVKFVKPIINSVKCRIALNSEIIQQVRDRVDQQQEFQIDLPLQYEDNEGNVYAVFTKTIYVAQKSFYKQKLISKKQSVTT